MALDLPIAVYGLPPLPDMRALALVHPTKGAELSFDTMVLTGAYAAFLREAPLISAESFAQLWFELGERWGGEMGLEFGVRLAEDWDRIRRAALAMNRPRDPEVALQ